MLGMKRGMAAVFAAIGAIAMLAPGAAEAGTWLSPVPVNTSTGSGASVALDATGNALVAWQTKPATGPTVVQGARHVVGTPGFSALPADFSTDTALMPGSIDPVVVTNRSGEGLAVWVDSPSLAHEQIQLRTIAPNGTTGLIVSVPSGGAPMTTDSNVAAAIDANGDAVVAWQDENGVDAITRQGLAGSFTNTSTPDQLAATTNAPPSVAIDGAGNAIVVWQLGATIQASRHPAGGSWSASPDTVSAALHSYSSPAVAANPSGQMVTAFVDNTGVSAVTGTVSGGWGASPTVTELGSPVVNHGPAVSVDDGGGAAVGWSTSTGAQVSVRPAGGSFPAPSGAQTLSPVPTAPDAFALAGDGHGDVVVAWDSFETAVMQNVVRAAVKPAGANTFGPTQIVSNPNSAVQFYAGTPTIALDENGDAVVAYQLGATPAGIGTAVYDGAGPLLGTPTVPATAAQGTSASFSVAQPLDAFSSVASVKWSFGDGSADATGTQVSHTFSAAGTFKVTVTATDAVGNSTSATGSITVTATPPGAKCVVPKLKGKSLSKAKSLLKAAHCKLGRVTKPKPRKHHKLGNLVVKSSSPKAGSNKPAGTKVSLKLQKAPKKHHKKKK
jgi:PKD repeat protein